MAYRLTAKGKDHVAWYLAECAAFRKELLDAGKDTADNTNLPTEEGILEDIEEWEDEDGVYVNSWGVTDNYDLPIDLTRGVHYEAI